MKLSALSILLNKEFIPNKKLYLVSGNEISLMEKISSIIIEKFQKTKNTSLKNISSIDNFVDETGLFENKRLFIAKNCKGFDNKNLEKIRGADCGFIFIQENSSKTKKVKNFFLKHEDCCLIDCYELDKESKVKVLNEFLNFNKIKGNRDVYWLLIEKIEGKYIFMENILTKILELDQEDINYNNIKNILTVDNTSKDKIFFHLFKKNRDIIGLYRDKILTPTDVNELFYYCRFFCQIIIDSVNEEEYEKKIPIYLFKEKNFLSDVYKNYTLEKKRLLLSLLSSTEKLLRNNDNLSLIHGLRFILNLKKITIS